MKKIVSLITVLSLLLVFPFCVPANAAILQPELDANEILVSQAEETLPNGLTIVTTITESVPSGDFITVFAAASTKTGSKTVTAKNSSGDVLYTFTVHGTFSYDGSSATCTASSYSYTIGSGSDWKLDYVSSSRSGNQAIASGHFYRKILFVTVETADPYVVLTCSASGVLS